MADVFIRQTKPVIVDENWPPKSETPIENEGLRFFPPAPQPIIRNDAPIILGQHMPTDPSGNSATDPNSTVHPDATILLGLAPLPQREDSRPPVTVGSTETRFTANAAPVSNESVAGKIYGEGPAQRHVNLPKPPNPVGNTEVHMTHTPGAPISNNSDQAIMRSPASDASDAARDSLLPPNAQLVPEFIQGITNAAINNEKAHFTFTPQPLPPQSDTVIQSSLFSHNQQNQNQNGVLQNVTVGNKDVHFVPGRPAQVNTGENTTFGGGGDPTKEPGQDDRSFAGRHTMNVGAGETYIAASGDNTRIAGEEDKVLTPNVGAVGNQETLTGSTGGPSVDSGREVGLGGKGKPKNVRG